ncbi:hypothetical protein ABZ348_25280 [Streptomyces sp. NPDC005963]|uniref:hypothetical protein n=1 Tax=Streptomyces sp. NPDC005963 TaxID=3156721 RepID=UPI0034028217
MSEQESTSHSSAVDPTVAAFLEGRCLSLRAAVTLVERSSLDGTVWRQWEELRDIAVGKMQRGELAAAERQQWGRVAIRAVERKRESSVEVKVAVAEEARVRAYLMCQFGPSDIESFRDPAALLSLVVKNIGMDREEIAREACNWMDLPREGILELRRVKNMLTPLKEVSESLKDGNPLWREVESWASLVSKLP